MTARAASAIDERGAEKFARAMLLDACRSAAGRGQVADDDWLWLVGPRGRFWARLLGFDGPVTSRAALRALKARRWHP